MPSQIDASREDISDLGIRCEAVEQVEENRWVAELLGVLWEGLQEHCTVLAYWPLIHYNAIPQLFCCSNKLFDALLTLLV